MSVPGGAFVGSQTNKGKNEPISPYGRSSRAPWPDRRKGTGAPPRRKGLGKRLQHVKEILECLPFEPSEWAYAEPRVRPNCRVYATPAKAVGGSAALGLSKERNSQNECRRGLSGMPRSARQQIDDTLSLMEDFRERLAFWTVTLPDEDYREMVGTDMWPCFQRRLNDLLIRYLREVGDEALVVGVVEIGDVRAARTRRPMPHIHVVTTGWGRKHPQGGWVLRPSVMDSLVDQAARYAGLPRRSREAASQIQQVKKSARKYLSKYMTKNDPSKEMDVSEGWEDLVPHQWWNRSEAAKALVDGHVFRLPAAFAAFLVARQNQLEGMGLGKAGLVTVGYRKTLTGDFPIQYVAFDFRTPENLHQALELYALWEFQRRHDPPLSGRGGMVP